MSTCEHDHFPEGALYGSVALGYLEQLQFIFYQRCPKDPRFRHVRLPDGWQLLLSPDRWVVIDAHRRKRLAIEPFIGGGPALDVSFYCYYTIYVEAQGADQGGCMVRIRVATADKYVATDVTMHWPCALFSTMFFVYEDAFRARMLRVMAREGLTEVDNPLAYWND